MSTPAAPKLEPGRVYRTADLAQWSANPSRLAKRLVRDGQLRPFQFNGLYACPKQSRFGPVPPSADEALRKFLKGSPYVVTGSERWNALALGTTAVFATTLVYNRKRSGVFKLGGRTFRLRRVAFPENPPTEWFVVDLLEHADQAGADRRELVERLARAVESGRFDAKRLNDMARDYGTKATQRLVRSATDRNDFRT